MDNTPDKTIVTLMRGIKTHESGGNYNQAPETAGTSLGGAYMYQKPTWQGYAKDTVGDANLPFTPENQDKVTYLKIKQWKEQGLNPEQIISKWNPGAGSKYVDMVKKAIIGQTAQASSATSKTDAPQNFTDYLKENPNPNDSQSSPDKAGSVTTPGNNGIFNAVANLTPGNKLAQGMGYALAAALPGDLGSQKGLIKANNEGIDIQGQLLEQIKRNKAKGKDTSKLEKAVRELTGNIVSQGNNVSDVGTGGITTGQVLRSAAGLAALPVASYLGGALSGGGIANTGNGLVSGSMKLAQGALSSSKLAGALEGLSASEKLNALTEALSEKGLSASSKALVQQAIKEVTPAAYKELGIPLEKVSQGLLPRALKGGYNVAKGYALTKLLGNAVGGVIHQNTK